MNDIFEEFDSSKYNELVMCYVRAAVRELTDEDTLEEEQARAVRNRVSLLMSERRAADVWKE